MVAAAVLLTLPACKVDLIDIEHREAFLETKSHDDDECESTAKNSDLTRFTKACKSSGITEMTAGFSIMCETYKRLGFESVSFEAKEATATCEVADCACSKPIPRPQSPTTTKGAQK